ncbi:MAG: hypothetical protein APF80_07270 [Alphaproteobacteria bacterium BRH_c36]|nr:MAG: hypothetical protein APF80_07270 [Alphaproteobacteria bacterium BRH_c36]
MSRVERLERLIGDTARRLERAEKEVAKIRNELLELRTKLNDARAQQQQLDLPFEKRGRRPSEKWSAVLNFMLLRSPNPVSIDEILQFASENDLDITRASTRAQLHHYVQRGILERLGDGLYAPTFLTKGFCDY